MGEFAIGQSVLRREDPRLLRGRGRYFDDLKLADQLHAAIVRSPHAHADIRGIDTGAALTDARRPCRADRRGLSPRTRSARCRRWRRTRSATAARCICRRGRRSPSIASCMSAIRSRWWSPTRSISPATPPSASRSITRRGRPWCRRATAFEQGAPQLYGDCPNNEAYFYQAGDKAKTDAAFASAAHVVEQRLVINRVTANPIEPRGVTGDLRRRHAALHAALRLPAALAVPQRHRPHHAENSRSRAAARHRRHRRLLRAARLGLSGNHPDAVGGAHASAGR